MNTAKELMAHAASMELKAVEFLGADGTFARRWSALKTVRYTFHDGKQFHLTARENDKLDDFHFTLRKSRDDA